MGKPVCARASRSDSRRRGSTSIETETKAPSRPDSEGLTGNVLGQTLIDSSSIRRRGPAENKKPWSPKAPGSKCYRTDRLAFSTFFSVVAISQARKALNQSTSISDYHYGGGEATGLMIGQRFRNRVGRHLQNVLEAWRCQHWGRKGRFAVSVSGLGEARIKELGTPWLPAYAGGRAGN